MNKYLKTLTKIKSSKSNENYLQQLEKIEQYVKGEITTAELMQGTNDTTKGIIYYTINKIINYEDKDIKYYIELPKDMFFNTMGAGCILAGRVKKVNINYNDMETIGPKYQIKQMGSSFFDEHYIEITGDFSQVPNGVMLYRADWYRIIAKYPNLVQRMYNLTINDYELGHKYKSLTMDQMKENIEEYLSRYLNAPQDGEPRSWWKGKDKAQYLPQKVIDSISFVVPIEYLSKEQVLSGEFGSFEELLARPVKEKQVIEDVQSQSVQKTNTIVHDDIVRVGYGDILDYIRSTCKNYIDHAIDFDMPNITERAVVGRSDKEKVLMLVDFIINYKGEQIDNHMHRFNTNADDKLLNSRISNIPLLAFAKLNSDEIVEKLQSMGANDVSTEQSENEELVKATAELLKLGTGNKRTLQDTIVIVDNMIGKNAEKAFKKR